MRRRSTTTAAAAMFSRSLALSLALALALSPRAARAQEPVLLGEFSREQHNLSGTLYALNDRVLEVRNFNYDGNGPDAFFWGDRGTSATRGGRILPERPDCAVRPLGEFRDRTVIFELPPGETLRDFNYISVWCRRASSSFGGLQIDKTLVANLPSGAADTECSRAMVEPFPVAEDMSCEPLEAENFQVRWRVDGDNLLVELVGRITSEQYMGFGPSGVNTETNMNDADPAIAHDEGGDPTVVDFAMTDRSQCSRGVGVCPDTVVSTPGEDHLTMVNASRSNDLLRVLYSRPLAASEALDRPFLAGSPTEETFIVWAIGPVQAGTVLPQFHLTRTIPRGESVSFAFGRARRNNCPNMLFSRDEQETAANSPPPQPPFEGRRPIVAKPGVPIVSRIGPSGGSRGREAVAGVPGWGIAWYMDDQLVPVIGVERNRTYTFSVQGGVDTGTSSKHHPLYITLDEQGGLLAKTPTERLNETVYAQPVDGLLCEYRETNAAARNQSSYDTYLESLDRSCADNATIQGGARNLKWAVAPDTPDIVYYQCATHRDLGFKIRVFDFNATDVAELETMNSNACSVSFGGTTRAFQGCRKGLSAGVSVYWNADRDANTLETLFTGTPPENGYVGWGWGSTSMVPSNAVIAYNLPGSGPMIEDYSLTGRSTAGVQVGGAQNLQRKEVEVDGQTGEVRGLFVRAFDENVKFGPTGAIWAVGPAVTGRNSLTQHTNRAARVIDISRLTGGGESDVVIRLSTILKVHGGMMAGAWIVLAPMGALAMRFLKRWNPATFQSHRALMVTAVAVGVVAFVLGVVNSGQRRLSHLILGSIVVGVSALQVLGGLLRPAKGSGQRGIFNLLHGWGGRIGIVVAWVNVYIGLSIAGAKWWLYLLASLGIALWLIVFAVLSTVLSSQFPTTEKEGTEEPNAAAEEGQTGM